jgi:hypothetical protein
MFTLLVFHFSIGNKIQDLKLGVVNQECFIINSEVIGSNLSCQFINEFLKLDRAQLLHYSSPDEAFSKAKKGQLDGVLIFPQNSSINVMEWMKTNIGNYLDIYLDHTDIRKCLCLKFGLLFAFKNFSDQVMREYMDMPGMFLGIDVEPLFSPIEGNYKENIFSGLLIA